MCEHGNDWSGNQPLGFSRNRDWPSTPKSSHTCLTYVQVWLQYVAQDHLHGGGGWT